MKALSIISIIFAVIFVLWFFLFVTSNGRISIYEFAPVGIMYGIWNLLYAIIATIYTSKRNKII